MSTMASQNPEAPRLSNEKRNFDQVEKRDPDSLSNDLPQIDDDPVEAKRIVRKVDWRLIPLLVLLYTLAFLDRVNIGNARLWNLEEDLGMKGYDYNIAILVFYIPYILLEIPSNMILSRVQPRYYISALVMGWGLTITFGGFCQNFAGLLVVRIFIGIFESGMFPGCIFLISSWYRRHQLLVRMAWFMVSNDIAGTISGLLGAGLGSLGNTGKHSGWRYIFWVEGALTCSAAVLAFFFIPPFPHQSKFLKEEEKAWLLRKLDEDNQTNGAKHEKMTARGVLHALKDWKILTAGALYLGVCVTAYSISVFTPTILVTFGWDSLKSNLLTAPLRVVSGIVSVAVGFWSDKAKRRGPFCLFGYLFSCTGLLMCMLLRSGGLRYTGLYFAAVGIYICQPLVIAWCVNQVVGNVKRGTVTAFAVSSGQVGGIISALVFPKKDGPYYVPGISTCIAFQALALLAAINMWFCCRRENKAREAGKRDHRKALPQDEVDKLGERHPDFRYTL